MSFKCTILGGKNHLLPGRNYPTSSSANIGLELSLGGPSYDLKIFKKWSNVCRNMTLYMTLFEKVYKVQFIEFLLPHDYNKIWNISLNCPVENSSLSTAFFSAAKNFSRPHNLSHSIVVIEKTWRELCFHVCSWLFRENPFQVNDSICILKLNKAPRETEVHVDPGTLALGCNSDLLCVQVNLIAICSSGIFRSIPTQVRAIGQHVLLWWQFGHLQGIARWSLLFVAIFQQNNSLQHQATFPISW